MTEIKYIEIRDRATFIPAIAVRLLPSDWNEVYLCRRVGYALNGNDVLLTVLTSGVGSNDPYGWGSRSRTMTNAHDYIIKNWATIESCDVVDVEFILGEKPEPSKPECEETESL